MKEGPEKVCDLCGENPAVMHLTQVVDNKTTTSNLCERCATERGLYTPAPPGKLPLADFLAKMGGGHSMEEEDQSKDLSCPFCGLTASAFKEAGRLGCPQCYSTFEVSLRGLLRRIHGGTQHVGKVYLPPDPSITDIEKRLEGLRKKLKRAIEAEDFERAALLRDQIKTLEPAS